MLSILTSEPGFLDSSDKAFRVGIVKRQQLQVVMVNRPVDSASPIRFIPWWEMSMKWSADTSAGERTAFFTTARVGD